MPQKDVDAVLAAASISPKVKKALLEHNFKNIATMTEKATQTAPINLDERDRAGMRAINAPDLSTFAQECIKRGLASGPER